MSKNNWKSNYKNNWNKVDYVLCSGTADGFCSKFNP